MFMFPASQAAETCNPYRQSELAASVNTKLSLRHSRGAFWTLMALVVACAGCSGGSSGQQAGGRGGRGGPGGPATVGFVVVRQGSPYSVHDLRKVGAGRAKSIIVLASDVQQEGEANDPDMGAIKTLLALRRTWKGQSRRDGSYRPVKENIAAAARSTPPAA